MSIPNPEPPTAHQRNENETYAGANFSGSPDRQRREPLRDSYLAHIDLDVCMIWAPPGNVEQEERAEFIAEAFNVHRETGLSPRELLEQRDGLLAALWRFDIEDAELEDGEEMTIAVTAEDQRILRAAIAATRETKGEG